MADNPNDFVSKQGVWRNRIVGFAEVHPQQIFSNPRNFRLHPAQQQEELSDILKKVGLVQDIIVSKRTGYVIDGHLRLELAIRENQPTVPVKYVDLEPQEENFVLSTFDGVTGHAVIDNKKLTELIKETPMLSEMLGEVGSTMEGLLTSLLNANVGFEVDGPEGNVNAGGRLKSKFGKGGDEDFDVEAALENLPLRTQLGDVWKCGRHLVICADSTDQKVLDLFFSEMRPTFVWSDPPYGINILPRRDGLGGGKTFDPIIGDGNTDTAKKAFTTYQKIIAKDAIQFWWGANNYPEVLPPSQNWLVWDKDHHGMSFADAELAWSSAKGVVRCFRHAWSGNHRASEQGVQKEHPTQKPLALFIYCADNYGHPEDIIVDPFLGSGISLVGAERLTGNHRVIGFELEPKYVDVTVKRWEAETGAPARILKNIYGKTPLDQNNGSSAGDFDPADYTGDNGAGQPVTANVGEEDIPF